MIRTNASLTKISLVAVLAACVVLSACGRRGPPEAPIATTEAVAPAI